MTIHQVDPLVDPRWAALVREHPRATVFHTVGWLRALSRTYGYRPVAYTTSAPGGTLRDGILFCEVQSWLTGRRLVGLPFSDHCDPLVDDDADRTRILEFVSATRDRRGWRYVELRERTAVPGAWPEWGRAFDQELDLRGGVDEVTRRFHPDGVRRQMRRAAHAGVVRVSGRTDEILRHFYALVLMTRRRHRLPPQPRAWYREVVAGLGDAATVTLAVAEGRPVAGILTLRHGATTVYKYGASDAARHALGGMPLLLGTAIQEACRSGGSRFDLGRTDADAPGLLAFKSHFGAQSVSLVARRYPHGARSSIGAASRVAEATRSALTYLPDAALVAAGRMLYRHAG